VLHDFRRTASTHLRDLEQQSGMAGDLAQREATAEASRRRPTLQSWADFVDSQIDIARQAANGTA
jgi:hypothetical protein